MDNLLKSTMDALTQLGFWADDKQVCIISASKEYDVRPGAHIEITKLEESL